MNLPDLELVVNSAASLVTGAVLTLVSVRAGGRDGLRRQLSAATTERRQQTAAELRKGLLTLQDLLWDGYSGEPPTPAVINEAVRSFERAVRRQKALLPVGAGHLTTSARQALGTVYGGAALGGFAASAAQQPLLEPDPHWIDVSLTWFDEAAACMHVWEDNPNLKKLALVRYAEWRRGEDEAHVSSQPRDRSPIAPAAGESSRPTAVPLPAASPPDGASAGALTFRSTYLVHDAEGSVLGVVRRERKAWVAHAWGHSPDDQTNATYSSRLAAALSLTRSANLPAAGA